MAVPVKDEDYRSATGTYRMDKFLEASSNFSKYRTRSPLEAPQNRGEFLEVSSGLQQDCALTASPVSAFLTE